MEVWHSGHFGKTSEVLLGSLGLWVDSPDEGPVAVVLSPKPRQAKAEASSSLSTNVGFMLAGLTVLL